MITYLQAFALMAASVLGNAEDNEIPRYRIEVGESREIEVVLPTAMTGYTAHSSDSEVAWVHGSASFAPGPRACALIKGVLPGVAAINVPLPTLWRGRGAVASAYVEVVERVPSLSPVVREGRARPVRHPDRFGSFERVLFLSAHPDDELLAAPLLGRLCIASPASCTILSVTRGELGCAEADSCGATRFEELRSSASFLNMNVDTWSLPDGGGCVVSQSDCGWDHAAGGRDDLVAQLQDYILAGNFDLVLTFDPRHGSTCHPDHRAIGALAIEAIRELSSPPQLWMNETVLVGESPETFDFESRSPDWRRAIGVRASLPLGCSLTGWDLIHEVARRHPSQFGDAERAALRRIEANGFDLFSWHRWTIDFTWPATNTCSF